MNEAAVGRVCRVHQTVSCLPLNVTHFHSAVAAVLVHTMPNAQCHADDSFLRSFRF